MENLPLLSSSYTETYDETKPRFSTEASERKRTSIDFPVDFTADGKALPQNVPRTWLSEDWPSLTSTKSPSWHDGLGV